MRDSAEHELATNHYNEALRLWPSYASAHNNLGTLLPSSEMAEQHFLAAIRYSSDHINAHYNLGKLYRYAKLHQVFTENRNMFLVNSPI